MGGPFLALGLSALCVGAITLLRRETLSRLRRGPVLLAAMSGLFLAAMAARALGDTSQWVSLHSVAKACGLLLLVIGAALAVMANRARVRAEALVSAPPLTVDEALEQARSNEGRTGPVVVRGRIHASDPLISPGGVACAFYDAEIRAVCDDGSRGTLLRRERAQVQLLWLSGVRGQLAVPLGLLGVYGGKEIRRCSSSSPASKESESEEALSHERVGRLGEDCLIVGRIRRGPAAGTYLLEGVDGGAAVLCVGCDRAAPVKRLVRGAAVRFACAAAASASAAFLLASFR